MKVLLFQKINKKIFFSKRINSNFLKKSSDIDVNERELSDNFAIFL